MKSGQSGKMKNRLTEDVRRVLTNIIASDLHDPIFSELITIKDVKSVRGGHVIFVYFTVGFSNSEKDKKNAEKVKERLEKSAGFISGKICRALSLRRSPELRFEIDTVEEYVSKIDGLIDGERTADEARATGGEGVTDEEEPNNG